MCIRYIDPSLPTYIRITPEPLPKSWAHIIEPYLPENKIPKQPACW